MNDADQGDARVHARRTRRLLTCATCWVVVAACRGDAPPARGMEDSVSVPAASEPPRAARLEALLSTLAADSMRGRRTGTEGARMAARFLAAELEKYGVRPAGDDGFFQAVPLARVEVQTQGGTRERLVLPSDDVDFGELAPERILRGEANVVGLIPGSDPDVADEAVVIGAHYDHVGVGAAVEGDSIYNGADDDGSGVVAILEVARALVRCPAPRRTVVVLLSTAEEQGLLGTYWYVRSPVVPLEQTVANLQIEMIGRPDSLAGGFGRGWLTGYERTTMGEQLARSGSPIVPDPRPEMGFFFRSDNVAFARVGIPAHTLSSYNMHADYHRPSDEVDQVDFDHMAALVEAAAEAVRFLTDGPTPEWNEGGRAGLDGN